MQLFLTDYSTENDISLFQRGKREASLLRSAEWINVVVFAYVRPKNKFADMKHLTESQFVQCCKTRVRKQA